MIRPLQDVLSSFTINMRRAGAWTIGFAVMMVLTPLALGQTYQIIHRFAGGDGQHPSTGLSIDATGRLYGTTPGTVFRLTPSGSSWVLSTLHTFLGGTDGSNPGGRVIIGPDGSLYGTTSEGGSQGYGTVFRLRPPLNACKAALCPWAETILHAFAGSDGNGPVGDLVFDVAGNLYGATLQGGEQYNDKGVVYELTPSDGGWMERVLYNFPLYTLHNPRAGVTLDKAGNLYGTVEESGFQGGYGAVFQLTPSGSSWSENTLYVFQGGSDGATPYTGLIFDDAGNLFGATTTSGANGGGTVFELMSSNGGWAFSVLYGFAGVCCFLDGPQANLAMDEAGNLYGTTFADGAYGLGNVFKLSPGPSGWSYTSLHDFTGLPDGANPKSNVVFDANGNLYGTTSAGGGRTDICDGGCGTIWRITP